MSRSRRPDVHEQLIQQNRKSQGNGYRIPKQQPGTIVALARDPRGPEFGRVIRGRVLDHTGFILSVVWDHEPDVVEEWRADEVRYKVDRGLMRLTPPPKKRRLRLAADLLECRTCGAKGKKRKKCPPDHKGPGALKPEQWGEGKKAPTLTREDESPKMSSSTRGAFRPETEENTLTTQTFSAKEVAKELGMDARNLRKFLRSSKSPIEAVGQGNRYEFSAKDVAKLKKFFDGTKASTTETAAPATKKSKKNKAPKTEPKKPRSMMSEEERRQWQEETEAAVQGNMNPDDATADENGFTDQDYADHQEVDLDALAGPSPEELEDLEIEVDENEG